VDDGVFDADRAWCGLLHVYDLHVEHDSPEVPAGAKGDRGEDEEW
jgi:hypothetical protein